MQAIEKLDSFLQSLAIHPMVNNLQFEASLQGKQYRFRSADADDRQLIQSKHLITSTSKVFAASLTLLLEQEGVLSLEDPIKKYLAKDQYIGLKGDSLSMAAGDVTIRELLSHTSGIPSYYSKMALPKGSKYTEASAADPGWDLDTALDIARSLPKKKKVRTTEKADYSFSNFLLLSNILERVGGTNLPMLLGDRILDPLGLKDTRLLTRENLSEFETISSVYFGKELYLGSRRIASLKLDGAMISTTQDVLLFAQALASGRVGSGIFEQMSQHFKPLYLGISYGLGLMRFELPGRGFERRQVLYGHLGASGHFLLMDPKRDLFVSGTTNQLGKPLLTYRTIRKIAKILA
jgi:CubicO group peptidase (beta-lactamase class C family)